MSVEAAFLLSSCFCQVNNLAEIVHLILEIPVQGRVAGFPFGSVGYVSLLFLLQRVGAVLVYCFKHLCVIYDEKL